MDFAADTTVLRKERGAFFTPPELAAFMAKWAVRTRHDSILEPSCGDAIFLAAAGDELRRWTTPQARQLAGYDIHEGSIAAGEARLAELGLDADLRLGDFFAADARSVYDAVLGNPPFIRFQGFGGQSRAASLERALAVGVSLSGLASSWAAFLVHASTFLKAGGRMGLVLPAELLSVNYAGPVREYLLRSFASIELILFENLIFPGVQADVVVLLADGYLTGAADSFVVHQAKNVETLSRQQGRARTPASPSDKWTHLLATGSAEELLDGPSHAGLIEPLSNWGGVASGIVTGANSFFTLSEKRARELDLDRADLLPLLPTGVSLLAHHRIDHTFVREAGEGARTLLFRPQGKLSKAARAYIATGEAAGLNERYKCRVREDWWRVPFARVPEFFVSYMSGSTPRIVRNAASMLHLNSIHGLFAAAGTAAAAGDALPLLSLNSYSLLSAELAGRTYGGGVLKLEPREAGRWSVASRQTAAYLAAEQADEVQHGLKLIRGGDLQAATAVADALLLLAAERSGQALPNIHEARDARSEMLNRRMTRGSGKSRASVMERVL